MASEKRRSIAFTCNLPESGFFNAHVLARELRIEPYAAVRMASGIRRELVNLRESFVLETVFSDPVGEELAFRKRKGRRLRHRNGKLPSIRATCGNARLAGRTRYS